METVILCCHCIWGEEMEYNGLNGVKLHEKRNLSILAFMFSASHFLHHDSLSGKHITGPVHWWRDTKHLSDNNGL